MSSEEGDFFFTCPTPRDPSCQEYLKLRQPSWHGSLTIHIKGRKMIWLASDYNGSESVCVWVFSLRRWRNWLFSAFFFLLHLLAHHVRISGNKWLSSSSSSSYHADKVCSIKEPTHWWTNRRTFNYVWWKYGQWKRAVDKKNKASFLGRNCRRQKKRLPNN